MFVTAKISNDNNTSDGVFKTVILGGNGIYEKQNSWLGKSTKKVNNYNVLGYPDVEETFEFAFEADSTVNFPKIPKEAILYVIQWYRKITQKTGKEAQINFYWNKYKKEKITVDGESVKLSEIPTLKFWTDDIFSYVPKQINSQAQTSVHSHDKFYNEINKQIGLYVETHSHNSMNAFRSGTDEAYSYNDGVQLVFGTLNTHEIEMFSWASIQGVQKAGLSMSQLSQFIEFPQCTFREESKKVAFDKDILSNMHFDENIFADWDNQVVVYVPQPTKTYGGYAVGNQSQYGLFDDEFDYDDYLGYNQKGYSKGHSAKYSKYTSTRTFDRTDTYDTMIDTIVKEIVKPLIHSGQIDSDFTEYAEVEQAIETIKKTTKFWSRALVTESRLTDMLTEILYECI